MPNLPGDGCTSTPNEQLPLDADAAAQLSRRLKALADPVRLQLVALISAHVGGEACVCDLTGAFDVTAPTISHHLKVLREAGVLRAERRGTWVHYRVQRDVLGSIGTQLGQVVAPGERELVSAAPAKSH